ncbi:LOW QUALITY PROTEIN: odorant-binding protein-like [Onychomys torridus]|uniref:LOW QUALITY PROTEIN: odorant-binding protein-like n=1 Tax=Onychomys torridus TaxID=38674 RepID=UPI00167FBCDD|nr:LOW QUALITY PROTEIN: odorant-binding protein-like [Onychomys torridus]
MVKFLLLALVFGLAHAHNQVSGKWRSSALIADRAAKIEKGASLRLYLREILCNEDGSEMEVTFYVKANGQCSKTKVIGYKQEDGTYRTQYEGDNHYQPVTHLTEEHAVFTSKNVDRAGRETNLIFVLGKGKPLTEEERKKLKEYAEEHGIPQENIRELLPTAVIVICA